MWGIGSGVGVAVFRKGEDGGGFPGPAREDALQSSQGRRKRGSRVNGREVAAAGAEGCDNDCAAAVRGDRVVDYPVGYAWG